MIVCGCVLAPLAMAVLAAPADTEDAATPDEPLRGERRAALLSAGVVAPLFGIGQAAFGWFWDGTAADALARGAVGWLGSAALLVLLSPWSRRLVAKAVLATVGRVPWSLMEFLRDAHRGGLLQRSGGVYRFRHLRLQEHLTGKRGNAPGPGAATVPAQQPPVAGAWQHPATATAPAPPAPPPSLRDAIRAAETRPLAARGRWTVLEDGPGGFRAVGRERRVVMAHWPVLVLLGGLTLLRGAISGDWAAGIGGATAWLFIAVLVSFLSWPLKPPLRTEVHLTGDHLSFTVGRCGGWVAWSDVDAVAVRRITRRGRDTRVSGVQIRLRPGAPAPHRPLRCDGDWYCVLPLGFARVVPADLDAALARFAGPRRQPPEGPRG